MSRVLIVAGGADAEFAEEVRRTTRGLDIEIARALPAGEQRTVLLVWSAAAPATSADVPTLIELWSQGRLVIARRDDTALLLGLGDLDSVPPGAPVRETALKLLHGALAPGDGPAVAAPLPTSTPVETPPPAYAPVPGEMARSTRRWPMAVMAIVLMLVVTGGVASWMLSASPPPGIRSAGPEEATIRRDIEAAARRMQEELSQRTQSSGGDREARVLAERAAAERAAAERAAMELKAREPSPATSASPSSLPPPPRASAPPPPPPLAPPPPSSAGPADDARIVDLERQIAELKSRLEPGAVDASRATASALPGWAPWALAGVVVVLLTSLLVLVRRRRVRVAAEPVAVFVPASAARPETIPGPVLPPAAVGDALFVSYAHHDRLRVDPLVLEIEGMGRAVWIDRTGMTGGPGWAGQIARAIKGSRAVVLMASPSAYASDQVVRELYLAMGSKKIIVPIELEPADMPDELAYILAPFQRHALQSVDMRSVLSRALDAV